ncbi:MAG: hypothetical protein KA368_09860 [Acidobacteria bacterium]|nr:hypothetical protein [Acidobacteriota bacterium]
MTRSLRKAVIAATLLSLVVSAVSPNVYSQGRMRSVPARDSESTQPIPAGAQFIPAGTIIILEMDDRLSSAGSRVSDRFRAHVVSPVVDGANKTLINVGTVVEGHVSTVSKAKWRHRSGILAIEFDNLRRPNGTPVPVKAALTSANADDRKRLDEEGNVKAGSSIKRDIVFIGGGAGAGAAIGVFTGGILLGAGIGAAAGLTAALLMKGQDVVIEPGERFGMVLTQQIASNALLPTNISPITPSQPLTPTSPITANPPIYTPPVQQSDPNRQLPGPLNPYDVTATRESDGSVRLRVNADAPSAGWRVFSNHENIASNAVRIRLRGTPPPSSSYNAQLRQSTITPVPEICLDDRSGLLRRADMMDRYGRRLFSVDIPYQPGNRYARAPVAPANPGTSYSGTTNPGASYPGATNPPVYTPPSTGQQGGTQPPASSLAAMAQSAAQKVDVIRRQYGNDLNYMIDRNGQATFFGTQPPAAEQKQFFDGLMALHASLLKLQTGASDANTSRVNAQKVQEDANFTNQAWRRVRLDANTNNRWSAAYTEISSLLSVALR